MGLAAALEASGRIADAFVRYRRACELGSLMGCRTLGKMYADGNGVDPDRATALALLAKVCAAHDTLGCVYQRDVATRIYPLQRVTVATFTIGYAGVGISKATRTKAEARALVDAAVRELASGAAFDAVASKYRDTDFDIHEDNLFKHDLTGGDAKQIEFERAIFGLKPSTAYASENPSFGFVVFYRLADRA